jgi:C4-dicarboxylate transporter DctM subunit
MLIAILFLVFLCLALGFPIFMALVLPSLASLLFFLRNLSLFIMSQRMIEGIDTFSLMCIPFFIFAAEVVGRGMIGHRLIRFAQVLVGHITGGLALTAIVACMIFGAISGAGAAAIVAIGPIVYPALKEAGYGEKFSGGIVLTSSTLAMLVPPGIAMILYSIITGTSIAKVFMAGLGVGILVGIILSIYSIIWAQRIHLKREKRASLIEIRKAFGSAVWAMGLPVLIIGGIYSGYYTATEASGMAAVYAVVIELLIYRHLRIKDVYALAVRSGVQTAMIFMLIAGGAIFSWVMTVAQVPQMLTQSLAGASSIVLLLLVNIIFLIAGMLIDPNSAIIILVPLVFPLAMKLGIDPVHLGMIVVTNMAIGMLTPPFGFNIFVGSMTFEISYSKVVPAVLPFIMLLLGVLILVSYLSPIALWLPNALGM